jgi:hypothetical protein
MEMRRYGQAQSLFVVSQLLQLSLTEQTISDEYFGRLHGKEVIKAQRSSRSLSFLQSSRDTLVERGEYRKRKLLVLTAIGSAVRNV